MEISVARFKCGHPKCTLRANNDFSVQTIYEHIGQHLFQDTGSFDHFNLHCSCGNKYHFALMPYATVHLDQHKHDGSRHQIMCSPISLNDVNASKMMLSYQKRFIQFSGYKTEIDTCPDLTVYARESVTRNQAAPAMNSVPAKNYGSHQSRHERHFENRDREASPINVRTPVFGRSPSPPPKRPASRPSAPHDSREPPRSNGNSGGFNRHESPSRQGRQSRPYSPPRESFDRSGFGRGSERARSVGPREQHGGRLPPPPPPITLRRGGFDRSSFGRNSDGRSSGKLNSQDRRSSAPYSPQRGRSDRGGFNSDRGGSFGRENSGDGEKRSFGDRGGFGRGRGRGRGSNENGQNRFGGRHVDNINSHMASNRGNVGSGDGPEPDGARKRQREGLSPRSSDDEGQNARRSGNPVNVDRNGNSDFSGNAFNGGNAKNKAAGKTIRDGTSPRSSDDEDKEIITVG